MAYFVPIVAPRCAVCHVKKATVELRNRFNGTIGYYCLKHGQLEMAHLAAQERPKES